MQRIHLALLAVLALPVACRSNDTPEMSKEQKVEFYRDSALQYWTMGDLDRCQDQVQKGLEVDPDDKSLNLLLGWVLQKRGRTEDVLAAEQVFRANLDHDDPRINLGLGLALERKGVLHDEAAREIEAGTRPTDAVDPLARARELRTVAQSSWKEALENFDVALSRKIEDYDALNGKTRVLSLLGRPEESIATADELLAIVTATTEHYRKLLLSSELSERDEQNARDMLARENQFEVKVRLHVATVLRGLGRNVEAADHLERVLALDPELAEAHSRLAQVLFDLGDYQRATYYIDRFISLSTLPVEHPSVQQAFDLRGRCVSKLASERGG